MEAWSDRSIGNIAVCVQQQWSYCAGGIQELVGRPAASFIFVFFTLIECQWTHLFSRWEVWPYKECAAHSAFVFWFVYSCILGYGGGQGVGLRHVCKGGGQGCRQTLLI